MNTNGTRLHVLGTPTIREKMREYLLTHETLPPDVEMAKIIGCATGSMSSTRSDLRKEGFRFNGTPDTGWMVIPPSPGSSLLRKRSATLPLSDDLLEDLISWMELGLDVLRHHRERQP